MSADKAKTQLDGLDAPLHNAHISEDQLDDVINNPQKPNRKVAAKSSQEIKEA